MRTIVHEKYLEELAKRIVEGEEQAFRDFMAFYGPRFRGLFIHGGLPASEAEALAISAMTDILLKVPGGYRADENGRFGAWVIKAAKNRLVDWWRKSSRRGPATIPLNEALHSPAEHGLPGECDVDLLCAVEEAKQVLSSTEQEILTLRYSRNSYSFPKIAEMLGLKPGTVRQKHARALKKLEPLLVNDVRVKKPRKESAKILEEQP